MELVVAGHADYLVTLVKDRRGGRAWLRRALTYSRIDRFSPRSIAADKRSAVGAKSG